MIFKIFGLEYSKNVLNLILYLIFFLLFIVVIDKINELLWIEWFVVLFFNYEIYWFWDKWEVFYLGWIG